MATTFAFQWGIYMSQEMKVLLLESDTKLRLHLAMVLSGISGVNVNNVNSEGRDGVTDTQIADLVEGFNPDLVIMGWKDFGNIVLRIVKQHRCQRHHAGHPIEVWVMSSFPPRKLHREADIADLILWKLLMTGSILKMLVERTKELWATGKRMD